MTESVEGWWYWENVEWTQKSGRAKETMDRTNTSDERCRATGVVITRKRCCQSVTSDVVANHSSKTKYLDILRLLYTTYIKAWNDDMLSYTRGNILFLSSIGFWPTLNNKNSCSYMVGHVDSLIRIKRDCWCRISWYIFLTELFLTANWMHRIKNLQDLFVIFQMIHSVFP